MHATDTHFDPNQPVFWKFNAAQLATVILALTGGAFSAGVTWTIVKTNLAGVQDGILGLQIKLEQIDREGPRATQGLPDRVSKLESYTASIDHDGPAYAQRKNFDGRLSKVEARQDTSDANSALASQRTAQGDEISRSNERRVTALESNMIQLLPAVKEIQVNTQWLMKQQGGK